MNLPKILLIAVSFSICLFSCQASAQEILTWGDCLAETKKNNPDLISEEENIKQSEASKKITASGLLPQIDSNASVTRGGTKGQTSNTHTYGVSSSQLLFDGLKTVNNVGAASENLKAAQQKYRFTSSQVRFRLRSAFIDLLRAQELIKVSEDIVKIRRSSLQLIALRYESGLEHKGALLTEEANLAQAEFEYNQAKRSLEVAQRQLTKELGRMEFVPVTVQGDFTVSDFSLEKPDFETLAKNNPYLQQLTAQENSAAFGIKSAYGDFYPKISAQGGIDKTGTHWAPNKEQWDAGLTLTWPLFEGGLRLAQVGQARAAFRQAQAIKRSSRDGIVVTLEQTWADLRDAVERVSVQQKVLTAAEERSKISEAQYSTGFITYDNWSIIEDNRVQAKKAYLDTQANALAAEASWIQAKGETLEYAQ